MSELSSSFEKYLEFLRPGISEDWVGAAPDSISAIESYVGRSMPTFYAWFLNRMGAGMGRLEYPNIDMTAQGVIEAYRSRLVEPSSRFALIGVDWKSSVRSHFFYDLEASGDYDSVVSSGELPEEDDLEPQFDRLVDMLVWGEFSARRIEGRALRCDGLLVGGGGEVKRELEPILVAQGLRCSFEMGPHSAVHDRGDVSIMITSEPSDPHPEMAWFTIAGESEAELRSVLGQISTGSTISVDIDGWVR